MKYYGLGWLDLDHLWWDDFDVMVRHIDAIRAEQRRQEAQRGDLW